MAEENDLGYLPSVYVPDQALEAYQDVLDDYVYHINECYVVDSDGTRFVPNSFYFGSEEGNYSFNFETDVDASWTVYFQGDVLTLDQDGTLIWFYDCEGNANEFARLQMGEGQAVANIVPPVTPTYDEPWQGISFYMTWNPEDGFVRSFDAESHIPYCDGGGDSGSVSS